MLKESAVEKVMLCISNCATVSKGCVSDFFSKTSLDSENCSLFIVGCGACQ